MEKYKFDDIFGPSKESAKKFLLFMCIVGPIGDVIVGIILALTHYMKTGEPNFNHLAEYAIDGCIELAYFTICYFIARWIAYRTNAFPDIKIREGVHFLAFIILLILSLVLAGIIIWQIR